MFNHNKNNTTCLTSSCEKDYCRCELDNSGIKLTTVAIIEPVPSCFIDNLGKMKNNNKMYDAPPLARAYRSTSPNHTELEHIYEEPMVIANHGTELVGNKQVLLESDIKKNNEKQRRFDDCKRQRGYCILFGLGSFFLLIIAGIIVGVVRGVAELRSNNEQLAAFHWSYSRYLMPETTLSPLEEPILMQDITQYDGDQTRDNALPLSSLIFAKQLYRVGQMVRVVLMTAIMVSFFLF